MLLPLRWQSKNLHNLKSPLFREGALFKGSIMSIAINSVLTAIGAIGMVITTEKVVVDLNYKTIPVLIIFTVIFAYGLISISKELNRRGKQQISSYKKKRRERNGPS